MLAPSESHLPLERQRFAQSEARDRLERLTWPGDEQRAPPRRVTTRAAFPAITRMMIMSEKERISFQPPHGRELLVTHREFVTNCLLSRDDS